jgi:Tfp pilus assembly protein PilF
LALSSPPVPVLALTAEDRELRAAEQRVAQLRARVALKRGRQLMAAGIDNLAEAQFREAVRLAPTSVEVHRELARFLSQQTQWLEAASAWREVMRLAGGRVVGGKPAGGPKNAVYAEAQREWMRAKSQLTAFWDTPNVVTFGADMRNPIVGSQRSALFRSYAMVHPARLRLEAQRRVIAGETKFFRAAFQTARRQVAVKHALPLQMRAQMEPLRNSGAGVGGNHIKRLSRAQRRHEAHRHAQQFVVARWAQMPQQARLWRTRQAARIALARAQQLDQQGVDELAELQLRHAVSLAPDWLEACRALARWQSQSEQWDVAAASWEKILAMPQAVETQVQVEAHLELRRARQALSMSRLAQVWENTTTVTLGADSRNLPSRWYVGSTLKSMAVLRPAESNAEQAVPLEAVAVAGNESTTSVAPAGPPQLKDGVQRSFQFSFHLPAAEEAAVAAKMRIEPVDSETVHSETATPFQIELSETPAWLERAPRPSALSTAKSLNSRNIKP